MQADAGGKAQDRHPERRQRMGASAGHLADRIRLYELGDQRWDSPIASDIARRSVSQWLDEVGADDDLRATATGLRGFFLADPDELSLLALVDQFAARTRLAVDDVPDRRRQRSLDGCAGRSARITTAPRHGTRGRLHRGQTVRASVRHRATVAQISCDYLVLALPATTLRRVPITPALPAQQHEAIGRLKYGRAAQDAAAVLAPASGARPGSPARSDRLAVRRRVGRQRATAWATQASSR